MFASGEKVKSLRHMDVNREEENMRSQFGELLAQRRKEKSLTLRKLSQFVGLSPSFLSEVETGRRLPPMDEGKVRDIAEVLGIDKEELALAARKERARKDTTFIEKLFESDPDSAYAFCREAENATSDTIPQVLKDLLKRLEKKG